MARIHPPYNELDQLPTKLNQGEWDVLEAFRELDDTWDVYVQPRLRMDQPDFVLLNDIYGICAVEVKNWSPKIYRPANNGVIEVETSSGWKKTNEAPRYQAKRYRTTIYEHYL